MPLLNIKAVYGVPDFDAAIRELTAVLCYGTDDSIRKLITETSVEQLYPLRELARCNEIRCGGCSSSDGTLIPGAAFAEFPRVDEDKIPFPDAVH